MARQFQTLILRNGSTRCDLSFASLNQRLHNKSFKADAINGAA